MNHIKKVINCSRTVELIQKALKVEYAIDSLSVSPLLYEIVFNELGIFIVNLESRLSCSKASRIKLLHVRYAEENLIFVRGTKLDANHTRLKIKNFLHYKGLSFNVDDITSTASGFTFLGAICQRVSKEMYDDSKVNTGGMRMNADSSRLYRKLVEWNTARYSNHSSIIPQGTANDSIINFLHVDIIKFYNVKIRELTSYYTFVSNRSILGGIIWQLRRSCALTLAKKHKLRTASASFKKFGKRLDCPLTGENLYIPKFLPTNKYKSNIQGRLFSTSVIQNTLPPYFITGLSDAEGCFRLKISQNKNYAVGWVVVPTFEIHLHEKDLPILNEIQRSLEGIGRLHRGKTSVSYSVTSKKDLLVLISHFENYPLITEKLHDYLLFRRAFSITSQGPLDSEKLQELVNIRASLNRGLTPVLREAFPLTLPTFVDKSLIKTPEIPSGD